MSTKIKNRLRPGSNRSFLARDFESFRQSLIQQAKIYFPDKIKDFSEPSVAGMLVDVAASIGDTMSFYLDHQFKELDPQSAVELNNILTHLRNAGVQPGGAAPSVVEVDLSFVVPADTLEVQGKKTHGPKLSCLPLVLENTLLKSDAGVFFNLTEEINFAEKDLNDKLVAKQKVHSFDASTNEPTQYKVTRKAVAVSGNETVQNVGISDIHVPFREINLSNTDVTEIISVSDSDGNTYYEVESLSQDSVFVPIDNVSPDDFDLVPKTLEIVPAPRRFVKITDLNTRTTRIRFGSGDSSVLDDDIVPDPSELSLELYGKKSFSKFSIDPKSLIGTQTLGISPKGTTIRVLYRHGGGLNHNVDANTIRTVETLLIEFRNSPTPAEALATRQSVTVNNKTQARGGANAPTIEELRLLIPSARNAQSRIVTRDDLLARIYTMPSMFGRVFRVGLSDNPINPLSLRMHIISRDKNGNLSVSPDQLKTNLRTYLNEFRLISDAIDILDASVVNYGIKYEVFVEKTANKPNTINAINSRLAEAFRIKFFQIDQPIVIDDIVNLIINAPGVVSLTDLKVHPITGTKDGRTYSSFTFPFEASTKNGVIRPPVGAIFEIKFPQFDIKGIAI